MPTLIANIYDSALFFSCYACSLIFTIFYLAKIREHYLDPLAVWPRYPVFFLFIEPGFLYPAPFGVAAILCSKAFLILS